MSAFSFCYCMKAAQLTIATFFFMLVKLLHFCNVNIFKFDCHSEISFYSDAYQNTEYFLIIHGHIDLCMCYWFWIISPHRLFTNLIFRFAYLLSLMVKVPGVWLGTMLSVSWNYLHQFKWIICLDGIVSHLLINRLSVSWLRKTILQIEEVR